MIQEVTFMGGVCHNVHELVVRQQIKVCHQYYVWVGVIGEDVINGRGNVFEEIRGAINGFGDKDIKEFDNCYTI